MTALADPGPRPAGAPAPAPEATAALVAIGARPAEAPQGTPGTAPAPGDPGTAAFVDIGALDDIPRQGARVVKTAHGCIAVFRTGDDQVFALDDRCPHKGGPLSEGIVHGTAVTCPLHNWVFDMNTGATRGPDTGTVRTHPVHVQNNRVMLNPKNTKNKG